MGGFAVEPEGSTYNRAWGPDGTCICVDGVNDDGVDNVIGPAAGGIAEAWPVKVWRHGRLNYEYVACRIADSATASVLRRRVRSSGLLGPTIGPLEAGRPEGRTVSPLEAGWASTSGYGIASRCDGVNVCVDNVNVGGGSASRGCLCVVVCFCGAVWLCVFVGLYGRGICGVCMGVVSVFVGVDSVVGGLVCGGCMGAEIWWTVSLVDWFVWQCGRGMCGNQTLVSSKSMSVLCVVGT